MLVPQSPSGHADPSLEFSVIIPVYQDWDALLVCLQALQKQSINPDRFEVVVVNNGDAPEPPEIPALEDQLRYVRILHEPRGFSYTARNAGIHAARGAILAFTDADCAPQPDWLQQAANYYKSTNHQLWAGNVQMTSADTNCVSLFESIYRIDQSWYVNHYGAAATANLFVLRACALELDGFDTRLQSGGDFDFCYRAQACGFRLGFAKDATVTHPAESSLKAVLRRNGRLLRGIRDMRTRHPSAASSANVPTVRRRPPLKTWLRIGLGSDPRTQYLKAWQRFQVLVVRLILYAHTLWCQIKEPALGKRDKRSW